MDTGIGISQVNNVSQRLNLAPQLLRWLQLLQAPAQELGNIVQHELETNPVLELDPLPQSESEMAVPQEIESKVDRPNADEMPASFDQDDLSKRLEVLHDLDNEWEDGTSYAGADAAASNPDDQERHQYMMDSVSAPVSLCEYLNRQLTVLHLNEQERRLAEYIIGSLDNRGYLDGSLKEIAEQANASQANVEKALAMIQKMDPPGVAARDLRECLMLQVNPQREPLAFAILRDCFDLLSRRDIKGIASALDVEEESVEEALQSICRLNPAPGLDIQRQPAEYITPDVTVHLEDGRYILEMNNDFVPPLRINEDCQRMLAEAKKMSPTDLAYLRKKMRSATFLIQGIAQRQQTLYKVASEIVRIQREFFELENGEIGALTMGKVAKIIGVHETTVSRAVFGKYIKTPRGVFALKAFFEIGYACSDGSARTPQQVKDVIEDIVTNEAPGKHLTDIDIVAIMKQRGLKIARRTVAKYRSELGLPSSKDRAVRSPKQKAPFIGETNVVLAASAV